MPGVREWISGAPADAQLAADTTGRDEAAPEMTTDTPSMQSETPTLPTDETVTVATPVEPAAVDATATDKYAFSETASQQDPQAADSASSLPPITSTPSEPVEGEQGAQENSVAVIPPQPTSDLPVVDANEIGTDQSANATDTAPLGTGTDPVTDTTSVAVCRPIRRLARTFRPKRQSLRPMRLPRRLCRVRAM